MRLKGKMVIVTGGARGLGRAYSLRLAKEGTKVVVADILEGKETAEARHSTEKPITHGDIMERGLG